MKADKQVSIEQIGPDTVKLSGPFNLESAPELRKALLRLARESVGKLAVDLSGVSHMDTSAVAVLVELANALQERGRKLRLSGLNDRAARIIRLANLDAVFGNDA